MVCWRGRENHRNNPDAFCSRKKSLHSKAAYWCCSCSCSLELPHCVSRCKHSVNLPANSGSMILRKAGAALAAGCTMIVKPSPETPLSVLALAELAMQAGFPKGVFSVLTTSLENTPPLSEALCRHPLIKKVTFTGSVSPIFTSHWLQD